MIRIFIVLGVAATILSIAVFTWTAFSFKTEIIDVSHLSPYSELVGKEVMLKREAVIAKNYENFVNENPYIIEEDEEKIYFEAKPRFHLPVGTKLSITGAKLFTHAVSGTTHSYVLGTVFIKELNQTVAFEHNWGEMPFVSYDGYGKPLEKEYWNFPLALWQESALLGKYYLE